MNARWFWVATLAVLALTGCRSNAKLYISRLEEENRLLGDRIYELEDQLSLCQGRCESTATVAPATSGPAITPPSGSPPPIFSPPPATSTAPRAPSHPGTLETPRVEMPSIPTPQGQVPPRLQPGGSAPPAANPGSANPPPSGGGAWRVGAPNAQVASITLNKSSTGGYDADGRPGDEGITASIEPRDAQGRLVAAAAPVSVVILDPAQQGEAARIARWEFSAEEIAAMAESTRQSEGIHLAMLWPDRPPQNGRLHLFVRYTTSDGRRLQADQPLEIDVVGRQAARQIHRWDSLAPMVRATPAPAPAAVAPVVVQAPPARDWSQSPAPAVASTPTIARPTPRVASRPSSPVTETEPQRQRPAWSPTR